MLPLMLLPTIAAVVAVADVVVDKATVHRFAVAVVAVVAAVAVVAVVAVVAAVVAVVVAAVEC